MEVIQLLLVKGITDRITDQVGPSLMEESDEKESVDAGGDGETDRVAAC